MGRCPHFEYFLLDAKVFYKRIKPLAIGLDAGEKAAIDRTVITVANDVSGH